MNHLTAIHWFIVTDPSLVHQGSQTLWNHLQPAFLRKTSDTRRSKVRLIIIMHHLTSIYWVIATHPSLVNQSDYSVTRDHRHFGTTSTRLSGGGSSLRKTSNRSKVSYVS